jgi:hypothetical protein
VTLEIDWIGHRRALDEHEAKYQEYLEEEARRREEEEVEKQSAKGPSGMAKFMATQICKEKGRAESFEMINRTTEGELTVISGRFHFKNGKSGLFKFKLKETPDGWKHRSR